MGTVLEPPGSGKSLSRKDPNSKSAIPSKRKYSQDYELASGKLAESVKHKTMHLEVNDDKGNDSENLSKSVKTKRKDSQLASNGDSSSEEDADKFLAAAQANAKARLSEKKVYNKLSKEAKRQRKGTIDLENCLNKEDMQGEGLNHSIKKGYYAKLGIERNPTFNSSYKFYPPVDNVIKEEDNEGKEGASKIRKSISEDTLNKMNDLEKVEEGKSPHSDLNTKSPEEEVKTIEEEPEEVPDQFPKKKKLIEGKRIRTRKFTMSDNPDQEEVISFATQESGNWRLDLVKAPPMARSGDRIRRDLLSKLTYQKIWLTPSEKPDSHQTVFIYDWDDTLLCTSFLNPTGFYEEDIEIPEMAKKHLEKLEKAVEKLVTASVKLGKVYIVTNAAEGWVQFSSKKYMPKVYEALKDVEIISARSLYEMQYPGDSYEWKMQAFTNIQKDLESSMITNIIACGDSRIEMEAARHIAKLFTTAFIKTVKFKETPTPEELIKQLNLVIQKLDHISSAPRNLTIRLERKGK